MTSGVKLSVRSFLKYFLLLFLSLHGDEIKLLIRNNAYPDKIRTTTIFVGYVCYMVNGYCILEAGEFCVICNELATEQG